MKIQTVKTIRLKSDGYANSSVECSDIVREIPLKRIVYRGRLLNKTVYVKLFIDPKSKKRHKELELTGLKKLADNNIPAPKVLFSGLTEHGDPVIITQAIPDGISLNEVWKTQTKEQDRLALMKKLLILIATHHNAGLQHDDPHPNNFFVTPDIIYTLDGADIIASNKPLNWLPSLENLGFVLAQFFPDNDHRALSLLPEYCKARNLAFDSELQQKTLKLICKKREWRKKKYLKKIYLECTQIASYSTNSSLQLLERTFNSSDMRSFLKLPDSYIDNVLDSNVALKKGNSSTVVQLEIDSSSFVIKRYNIKNSLHRLKRMFNHSRAERSWENAHLLGFYGIPTAQPVAIRINKTGPFRGRAWYIAEYLPGQTLTQFISDNQDNTRQLNNIVKQVAKIIIDLEKQMIAHGDFKASNFQVCKGKVYLIDLDSMKQYKTSHSFEAPRNKDLERFRKNWKTMPKIEALFIQTISNQRSLDNLS